jgi:sugar phosphate isomerase/epimerase
MTLTRREFALMAATAATALSKPNSKFSGVQIGAITYCFRSLPSSAPELLRYCTELGISSVELMGDAAESFAGAPQMRGPAFAGRQMTPERREAMKKLADERTQWRTSVSMDKYKELRKLYHGAGVDIAIVKLSLTAEMGDAEYDYVFNVAKALGARSVTMELPKEASLTQRIGDFAAKHKVYAGYHNHMQVNEQSWETALSQSKYNSINLDVGHFTAAINKSPIPFIKANAARITSFHLKDRRYGNEGADNLPWGQGSTPIKEVLQLMKTEKYTWPANIELEYAIGEGTTVMAEMKKCLQYCRQALTS